MRAYPVYLLIRGLGSFAGACAFTLNLVYQIQTVGLGPLELVLVGTVLEVTCFLAQVPTGVIADLYSRRLSVIAGYLLIGAGTLLEGLVPAFLAIVVGNVVWGIGSTCVDGAEEAWVSGEVGEERAPGVFTRGAQVGQVATVAGIGAGVLLAGAGLNLPIVAGAAVWLLLGVVLVFVMPERSFEPAAPAERGSFAAMRGQFVAGARVVRGRPVLVCLLAAGLFLGLGSEGWDRLQQAHFLQSLRFPSFGTPVVWFGVFSVVGMLGSVAVTEVVRRRLDPARPGRLGTMLVVAQLGVVAGVLVFAAAGEFWLAAAASVLVGLLRSVCHPLVASWLVANTEQRTRATVFSMSGQVDAAGQILGGPPVGMVGERLGIRAALALTGLLVLPAVGLYARAVALGRSRGGSGGGSAGRSRRVRREGADVIP
ncbi:MFS transporter, DHA3 family, tetracycline resistance protein [Actinopolymorpha cephalotaxi]|uniref:DHA3 family tetracycline resistance protein-like MFS transporter n=1 Tax=Actinopolymorpha cephalotaxi TaxID=504797 RepID=A0A1I2RCQ5_9ACTN|nr:MFS transporter [Actinopolymorpha cephalotaxi]NYH82356.1 DHA3 family tetracycline resistance protein-like MFS transporter [Actinopolymorpha cephalotaxi]SFG35621.1 MFS transporter, DHA3 family, tetracycline resistance protein [Actinopolymorpha cephalotaxi]